MLLLCKHSDHDQGVEIDPLAQHPEVVASKEVQVDKLGHFTARLEIQNMETDHFGQTSNY